MKQYRIIPVFLSLLLAFSLTACSGSSKTSESSSEAETSLSSDSSESENGKTTEELFNEENEILSENTDAWEIVFASMDKSSVDTSINYGDVLLSAIETAKDQLTDQEYEDLTAGAEKIREIENQISELSDTESDSGSGISFEVTDDLSYVVADDSSETEAFTAFEGHDLDGNAVDSSLFSDNSVTVVYFWFNGCTACVDELSLLSELNDELKESGGEVIGINTETLDGDEDAISQAKELLEAQNASFRNIYFDSDSDAGTFADSITAYPTTYIVDSDGNIVGDPIMGDLDEDTLSSLRELLRELTEG